jgi:hypothetical protein
MAPTARSTSFPFLNIISIGMEVDAPEDAEAPRTKKKKLAHIFDLV